MFSTTNTQTISANESDERRIALEYIADAWNSAEADGVDGEDLSHAAMFAALATLVRTYGEDATAKLIAEIPKRIAQGEYSLDRSIQ